MIRIKNLTKDFGHRKGIFDLSLEIQDKEVFGYLGPCKAGKTTTIRQLLGFTYPTRGRCFINGKNCHVKQDEIQKFTGYLPEESRLPGNMTGLEFLRFMAQMKEIRSIEPALKLAERFECNPDIKIRKMSIENKRKVNIISTFMHDPDVLLLDEPMNGLGALMRNRFLDLILEEKKRGKTIFYATNILDEAEHICDRIGMMRNGILVIVDDIQSLRALRKKSYTVSFETEQDVRRFMKENFKVKNIKGCQITVELTGIIQPLIQVLNNYTVTGLETQSEGLEEFFTHYYGGDRNA